jgi:hypothetical protein
MPTKVQGVPVSPLTGILDTRSSADQIPSNGLRFRQNFQTVAQGKLRRGSGWSKFLTKTSGYTNEDFHDQLVGFSGIRQPITLAKEFSNSNQILKKIVATQSKVALLDENGGNWQILGSGFGGEPVTSASAPRFKAEQLGDYVFLTNDFDPPMYHLLESAPDDEGDLLHEIPDMTVIGLTRAAQVWQFKNVIFFADVEMDLGRFAYRIVWSNFKDGLSYDPAKLESIAGFRDLYLHERILGGAQSANGFLIYTTHGIWEMTAVGGEQVFAFRRVYNGENNELQGVLFYPNTLIARKSTHLYIAKDGIYEFNQFTAEPQRVEWMHRCSDQLLNNIDDTNCKVHIAGAFGDEVLFFAAKVGDTDALPTMGLRLNVTYQAADTIDAGFSALMTCHSQAIPTLRDFIINEEICTIAEYIAAGYPWSNEGLPNPLPGGEAEFTPTVFYTHDSQTVDGFEVEDWTQETADPDSLCALLAGATLDSFCRGCKGTPIFAGASSQDWCLKEIGTVFYRERCANPTGLGTTDSNGYTSSVGSYILDGIHSLLRFSPMWAENNLIQIDEFRIDGLEVPQQTPAQMSLRIGISSQLKDPNLQDCGIVWHQHSAKDLRCMSNKTESQHLVGNTIPVDYISWMVYRKGKRMYAELSIKGTGGDSIFSKAVAQVSTEAVREY